MLKLDNISKYYRIAGKKRKILDGINLEIKKGEMLSITGKSGSGKSTLLNVISGITKPTSGKIYYNNKRIIYFLDIFSSHFRNKSIGFIFQTFRLLPDETVLSNILMPGRIKGWIGKKTRNYIDDIIKELEIEDFKQTKAGLLSGGQKQRAAIARALVNKPDIILADEPTANLDKDTSKEIFKILENLVKNGHAVLVVTHQDYLFEHSKLVYNLKDGRLEVLK